MNSIVAVSQDCHRPLIRELFQEYLQWGEGMISREYGVVFDHDSKLEAERTAAADMESLDKYMPPHGCLLLAFVDGQPTGIACLKELGPRIGEIKRMYVRPTARGQGQGRALLERLQHAARSIGYDALRLDSPGFAKEAHRIYRSFGFTEIAAYAGSEIPSELQKHWLYMEKNLLEEH